MRSRIYILKNKFVYELVSCTGEYHKPQNIYFCPDCVLHTNCKICQKIQLVIEKE